MLRERAADRAWTPAGVPGIDRSRFRNHARGAVVFVSPRKATARIEQERRA